MKKKLELAYKQAAPEDFDTYGEWEDTLKDGLEVDSKLKIPQMKAVDKARLKKYVGALKEDIIREVGKRIKLYLAID